MMGDCTRALLKMLLESSKTVELGEQTNNSSSLDILFLVKRLVVIGVILLLIYVVLASIGYVPGVGVYQNVGCGFGGCSAGCDGAKIKLNCESCGMNINQENMPTWKACTYLCFGRIVRGCPGPGIE